MQTETEETTLEEMTQIAVDCIREVCRPGYVPCNGLAVILREAKELGIPDLFDDEDLARFEKALQEAENSTKGEMVLGS